MYTHICCAFVGLDNKLDKMHGTNIKIVQFFIEVKIIGRYLQEERNWNLEKQHNEGYIICLSTPNVMGTSESLLNFTQKSVSNIYCQKYRTSRKWIMLK
jgi:hypothetical protein